MRREGPDDETVLGLMRPEDGERIAMAGGADRFDVVFAEPPSRPRRRFCLHILRHAQWGAGGVTGTFQISCAYSAIVRSEENQPICAVLRIAERHQEDLSRQRLKTLRCAL